METRFVPDAPGAWLVYDLGTLVLALPAEQRAVADAVAAMPRGGVPGVLAGLQAAGLPDDAPFAVVDAAGEGLHLALRGPATVAVGAETVTGLGADPWLERIVADAPVARLTVPGGEWTLAPAASAPATAPLGVAPPPALGVATPGPLPPRDRLEVTEVPELELSAPPPAQDESTVLLGDLRRAADDRTVVVDEIARLRARRGVAAPPPPAAPRAPALSLELPDGSLESLDTVVIVGRAPTVPASGPASRVVRLAGDGDISRTHARVAVEGGTVVVTDLGSRNGTVVRIPGRPAQRLRDGEPTPVLVGTVIDFGGGVELRVREG